MPRKILALLMGWCTLLATARADGPPPPPSANFRLHIASFGIAREPIYTEELIFRSGKIYVFPSNVKEVTIIDPSHSTLDIIDFGRRVQCEIAFSELDASMVKLKGSLLEAAEKLENQGGKAKLIEAKMARNLFEPKLEKSHDPKLLRVRLKNPVVEVDAEGEPEADPARLTLIHLALVNIARLGAYRAPNDLPPFIELEAIASLTGEKKLRPRSITSVYRLAGPPQKMRRTYDLVPTLTDREMEALLRIDRLREVAPSLRYEKYRGDR